MERGPLDWQGPTNGHAAKTYGELFSIVTHPAFRLGFLDAQHKRRFDHDCIIDRIKTETPAGALRRLGYDGDLFDRKSVELAQYRYEEGRLLVIQEGVVCKAWGQPDFPPRRVQDFIWNKADLNHSAPASEVSVAALRGEGLPLFKREASP